MKKEKLQDPEFYIEQLTKTRQSARIATVIGCLIIAITSIVANSYQGLFYAILMLLIVIAVAGLLALFARFLRKTAQKNLTPQNYQKVLQKITPERGSSLSKKHRTHSIAWLIGLAIAFLALASLSLMLDDKLAAENEILQQQIEAEQGNQAETLENQ